MPSTKIVDVDLPFVKELWKKVKEAGSFYSIGDGSSEAWFQSLFFGHSVVVEAKGAVLRFENGADFVELHPIILGPEPLRHPKETLREAHAMVASVFQNKPICCIVPNEMRGARRLALRSGMVEERSVTRALSGVPILCTVYVWRP